MPNGSYVTERFYLCTFQLATKKADWSNSTAKQNNPTAMRTRTIWLKLQYISFLPYKTWKLSSTINWLRTVSTFLPYLPRNSQIIKFLKLLRLIHKFLNNRDYQLRDPANDCISINVTSYDMITQSYSPLTLSFITFETDSWNQFIMKNLPDPLTNKWKAVNVVANRVFFHVNHLNIYWLILCIFDLRDSFQWRKVEHFSNKEHDNEQPIENISL